MKYKFCATLIIPVTFWYDNYSKVFTIAFDLNNWMRLLNFLLNLEWILSERGGEKKKENVKIKRVSRSLRSSGKEESWWNFQRGPPPPKKLIRWLHTLGVSWRFNARVGLPLIIIHIYIIPHSLTKVEKKKKRNHNFLYTKYNETLNFITIWNTL